MSEGTVQSFYSFLFFIYLFRLVEQALMVSDELVRVAILWNEMWHEGNVTRQLSLMIQGLEDASRLHFADHNVEAAIERLAPLHDMLKQGPETLVEMAFQQAHGRDLMEALEWTQVSLKFGDTNL